MAGWSPICNAILQSVSEEDDLAVACAMYTCIGETVKTIGVPCMSQEQLAKLMEELKKQLEQYMGRSAERLGNNFLGK